MNKLIRLLYQPYKWLIFVPVLIVATLFFALLAILVSTVFGANAAGFVGILWARVCTCFSLSTAKIIGKENIVAKESYVVVANHQSQFDILALYGWLTIDFRWVMKKELGKVPALGLASKKMGHIFLDRSNSQAAIDSLNKAADQIKDGVSVVFFPEGTRNKNYTTLMPFKNGAFKMAQQLDLPILPVTIVGTGTILPTKSFDLFPGKMNVIVHPPIYNTKGKSINVLKMDAIHKIESAMN